MLSAGLVLVPPAAAVVDDDILEISRPWGRGTGLVVVKIWRGAPAPLTGWLLGSAFVKRQQALGRT
jgi:hypothetical protein